MATRKIGVPKILTLAILAWGCGGRPDDAEWRESFSLAEHKTT
jgi:hypothetical protein